MVGDSTLPASATASYFRPMGFWRRLFGGSSSSDDLKPQRLDYLNEALALERQGDYDAALTSYRLALRDLPNDARILQNMAIAFTKTRRYDEAIRHYRRALELDNALAGAHYGLAFLLLKRGDPDGAARSEEHTSELQSLAYLVCRLLLEKKKQNRRNTIPTVNGYDG